MRVVWHRGRHSGCYIPKLDGYYATMKDESEEIVALRSVGRQSSVTCPDGGA
jgi:hypothetical protein